MIQKKIGVHNITVVKASNVDEFKEWVETNFIEISQQYVSGIEDYINRGYYYFVFDVVELEGYQTVEPIIYTFESDKLYYPIEITSYSQDFSSINLYILCYGVIDKETIYKPGLWPMAGFGEYVEVGRDELKEISDEIAIMDSAYFMYSKYEGNLSKPKDLVVEKDEVYTPSVFDKIGDWFGKLLDKLGLWYLLPSLSILLFIGFLGTYFHIILVDII